MVTLAKPPLGSLPFKSPIQVANLSFLFFLIIISVVLAITLHGILLCDNCMCDCAGGVHCPFCCRLCYNFVGGTFT